MFGIIADIVGSLASNMAADERQDDQQNFNEAEAAKNRDFEERMSNTAMQRRAADWKAAGFNPMLAFAGAGTGATTPGGSAASSGIASPVPNHSIAASLGTASQIELNEAISEKTRAEAERARAETEEIRGAKIPERIQNIEVMKQQIGESAVRIEKIWAEEVNIKQQTENLKAELPRIKATIDNLRALTKQAGAITGLTVEQTQEVKQRVAENLPKAERALMELEATAHRLHQPGLEASAAAADSATGHIGAAIRALTGSLNGILLGMPRGRSTTINNTYRR